MQNVSQNVRLEMTFVKDTPGKWGLGPSLEALGCVIGCFPRWGGVDKVSPEFLQALVPLRIG